ncbi:MAG: L-threonine 3-dehydrogenase [Defluviitaleaceae bacterium]|nr:L-threonine 3-dehydrogenase [Defluviitaleaceae bacterium]
MKAIVKKTAGQGGLVLEERPIPVPTSNEVLIKIKKTAICGTDVHIYNWDDWAKRTIKTPQIIGHEFVGEVVEVGANVTNVSAGQLVSGEGHIVCGVCRQCITGFQHMCANTVGVGVNMDGVFAEYTAFPAKNIWKCDPQIPLNILSILDPLGNATHTALSYNLLGEDVLITGAGPIGLMAVPIAKRAGARNVVITDINPKRLEMARQLGANLTYDVRTEKINIAEIPNMLQGFDIGLEMSGSAAAFNQMINSMICGGKIAILGILPVDSLINWDTVVFRGLTLKGIYGREMFNTWYQMTAMLQSGLVEDIQKVITHEFFYTDYAEAFEIMRMGESGKIILDWS